MKKALIVFAAAMALLSCTRTNPFFQEWKTPYGIPPFEKIQYGDYIPAIKAGIEAQRAELDAIVATVAYQVPPTYRLESYVINSGNIITASAQITLKRGDKPFTGVAIGDGPIDAAFKALEQIIGRHFELDDFRIRTVTQEKEAMGSALVRLRAGGKIYSGTGLSTDIIGASVRAYVSAVNKIVYEED